MDDEAYPAASRRDRLMGKLFGSRERKVSNPDRQQPADDRDLNDFLHGSSDKLTVPHPAPPSPHSGGGPPLLTKLDILSATRYPNALNVGTSSQQSLPLRAAPSPRSRRRKGLVVRFVDTFPEIIGEGGDECEIPTVDISRRKPPPRAPPRAPPPYQQHQQPPPPIPPPRSPLRPPDLNLITDDAPPQVGAPPDQLLTRQPSDAFKPASLRRVQTGYSDVLEPPSRSSSTGSARAVPAGKDVSAQYLDTPVISKDENRKSFIELQQAQMREAEGLAFAKAYRSSSAEAQQEWEDVKPPSDSRSGDSPEPNPPSFRPMDSPDQSERRLRQLAAPDQSPASIHSNTSSFNQSLNHGKQWSRLQDTQNGSPTSPQKPAMTSYEDAALKDFVTRSRHLFEIFRLHSEAVQPLMSSQSDGLARAALWWFLKGRMALEIAVRDGAKAPTSQQSKEILKQQSYADLAKGYWIVEEVLPALMARRPGPLDAEVEEVRKALSANLRKLSMSMKRNGFLPPEDAVLPQVLKLSIWETYSPVSQDIVALLHGQGGGSALAAPQRSTSSMTILESLPLGDTTEHFSYGRIEAEVYLMEQGVESQRLHFPCLLSMVRPQKSANLILVISSQNGAVQLKIQNTKGAGPTWEDLRWRNETCGLELKLPRGFLVVIQLSQADYRMLWSMYDFGEKVQSTLYPRKDERPVFHSTLRAFQYFDADPQSRQFPKEAVSSCEVAMFERIAKEGAATGPRYFHRGFRIAVVTGPRTRTLSGVNHAFTPQMPIQFAFLKDEQSKPALLLKLDNGRSKGRMVMSFAEDRERLTLHSLLLGSLVANDETVCCEVPLASFSISQRLRDATEGMACIKKLAWTRARVVNQEAEDGEQTQTVLAGRLRVVLDCHDGTVTDRMNLAPGEFKIRLDVHDVPRLSVLRPPQQDMTVAVSEGEVSRELPRELAEALQVVQLSATVRTLRFGSVRDLHAFQAAVTGYQVVFDGVAAAFAISRRRMVVPIHKKWEAGLTRVQVVQQRDSKVTQLLAFFEDFHHGSCMGFQLKGTDVFEAVGRGSKFGIKIDDAKFPLPKVVSVEDGASEAAADDASFVCLDHPDLPGEHDDITILFETEAERDRLVTALPAPVRNSRLQSMKFM